MKETYTFAPSPMVCSKRIMLTVDGDVIESRFAVERRNRTIHARMRDYLYELKHNEELVTSIIPLGDGVAVSVKQRGQY